MRILNHLTPNEKKASFSYVFLVFCLILFWVFIHFFWPHFDAQVMSIARQDRGKGFSALMAFINWWATSYQTVLSVFIASAIFFIASYKKEALFTLSVFIADGINIILKLLIHRPRPEGTGVFGKFQKASFPSGHVVHYVVFFGFVLTVMLVRSRIHWIIRWGIGLLCVLLIVGVSIARVGDHWPTDILAAYIIGFVMLAPVILQYLKKLRLHHEH